MKTLHNLGAASVKTHRKMNTVLHNLEMHPDQKNTRFLYQKAKEDDCSLYAGYHYSLLAICNTLKVYVVFIQCADGTVIVTKNEDGNFVVEDSERNN